MFISSPMNDSLKKNDLEWYNNPSVDLPYRPYGDDGDDEDDENEIDRKETYLTNIKGKECCHSFTQQAT